jgi:hypothetical protein
MTESPGERELADALRDVIGDEAARDVAASVAALRHEIQAPGSFKRVMWEWIETWDSPAGRRHRAAAARRGDSAAELAEELAGLLADADFAADLIRFRLTEVAAAAPRLLGDPPPDATAEERKAFCEPLLRQRDEWLDAEASRIGQDFAELADRLRIFGQLAERYADRTLPKVKPGPPRDSRRQHLVKMTVLCLRLAGVRIGTGERSPAVLALAAVLDWYPMNGDARQLLRDLKRSKHWALASRRDGAKPGGDSPGAAVKSHPP